MSSTANFQREVETIKHDVQANITPLIGSILEDSQKLFHQELALAKAEARQELTILKEAGMSFAGGASLAAVAGLLASLMLVHLLAWLMPTLPLFADYAIVSLLLGIPAALLITNARETLKKGSLH